MMTACSHGSLIRGRPFRTIKDAIYESIRILIPSIPESAPFKYWFGYANDKIEWEKMIKLLNVRTFPPFFSQRYNTRSNRSSPPPTSSPSPPPSPSPPSPPSTPPPRTHTRYPTNSPHFNLESTTMSMNEA